MKNKQVDLDLIVLDLCILVTTLGSNEYSQILDLIKGDTPNIEPNEDLINICINEIKKMSRDSGNNNAKEIVKEAVKLKNIMYKRWATTLMEELYE